MGGASWFVMAIHVSTCLCFLFVQVSNVSASKAIPKNKTNGATCRLFQCIRNTQSFVHTAHKQSMRCSWRLWQGMCPCTRVYVIVWMVSAETSTPFGTSTFSTINLFRFCRCVDSKMKVKLDMKHQWIVDDGGDIQWSGSSLVLVRKVDLRFVGAICVRFHEIRHCVFLRLAKVLEPCPFFWECIQNKQ